VNWERALVVLVLALVPVAIWLLRDIPQWQVGEFVRHNPGVSGADRFRLEDEARKTLTQIVLGAFGLILLYLTWRRVRITEQGHITERYTQAIEQLGKMEGDKPNVEVRLGGIYALERIALDSPRDHWTIMEVLTAYVRRNAPVPDDGADLARPSEDLAKVGTDIQAILTVLGRRRRGARREKEGQRLDLAATDLSGANLEGAHLEGANLDDAHLEMAYLGEAHLEGAMLDNTHLEGAGFLDAHLEWADLSEADLEEANLLCAHLEGASGLTVQQVKAARNWERAHYDPEFAKKLGLSTTGSDSHQAV